MARLAIAMTTAPRRDSTIWQAVRTLREAGFDETLHVFAEPGSTSLPTSRGVRIRQAAHRRGCFANWRHALSYLLLQSKSADDWLMVVQDDAVWAPGSAAILRMALTRYGQDRVGFLSPYVTDKDVSPDFVDGWNEYRGGWDFWGALAICMRHDAAIDLAWHPRFSQHGGPGAVDAVVAASMLDLGRPSCVHVPSLVDHVGATSTVGHDDVAGSLRGYRFSDQVVR